MCCTCMVFKMCATPLVLFALFKSLAGASSYFLFKCTLSILMCASELLAGRVKNMLMDLLFPSHRFGSFVNLRAQLQDLRL